MSFEDVEVLLSKQQKYLEELSNLQPNKSKTIDEVVKKSKESIISGSNIIEFNISYLDDIAGGMTRGELTTIGGRPGHGKTTLMLNIVKALTRQGLKVVLFNREMTNTAAIAKLITLESSKLSYKDMRKKELSILTVDEINKMCQLIVDKYQTLTMYDDIRDLDSTLREIKRIQPDVFIDDYIQLTESSKKQDRRFEIEEIMREYKWIAKKTTSSGILISQLNRDLEKRIDPTPTMGDYSEGATIEQMSENCWFRFYPYAFNPRDNDSLKAEFIAKKARYGKIGTYEVNFNGDKCLFSV